MHTYCKCSRLILARPHAIHSTLLFTPAWFLTPRKATMLCVCVFCCCCVWHKHAHPRPHSNAICLQVYYIVVNSVLECCKVDTRVFMHYTLYSMLNSWIPMDTHIHRIFAISHHNLYVSCMAVLCARRACASIITSHLKQHSLIYEFNLYANIPSHQLLSPLPLAARCLLLLFLLSLFINTKCGKDTLRTLAHIFLLFWIT